MTDWLEHDELYENVWYIQTVDLFCSPFRVSRTEPAWWWWWCCCCCYLPLLLVWRLCFVGKATTQACQRHLLWMCVWWQAQRCTHRHNIQTTLVHRNRIDGALWCCGSPCGVLHAIRSRVVYTHCDCVCCKLTFTFRWMEKSVGSNSGFMNVSAAMWHRIAVYRTNTSYPSAMYAYHMFLVLTGCSQTAVAIVKLSPLSSASRSNRSGRSTHFRRSDGRVAIIYPTHLLCVRSTARAQFGQMARRDGGPNNSRSRTPHSHSH